MVLVLEEFEDRIVVLDLGRISKEEIVELLPVELYSMVELSYPYLVREYDEAVICGIVRCKV